MPLYQIDFTQKKEYKIKCDDQLIHVEEYGHHAGIPAVFFHGGPGQGFSEKKAGYFDPNKYRIILIDQRGSGKSLPANDLQNNNTELLLNDAEHIRKVLGIDQWVIAGNSWGAALALLYSEKYPERVSGLILRGAFLARNEEALSDNSRASLAQPNAWIDFKSKTQDLLTAFHIDEALFNGYPETEKRVAIYHYLLTQDDFTIQQQATAVLAGWLNHIMALSPFPENEPGKLPDEDDVNAAIIEIHYSKNHYFLEENQILNQIAPIIQHKIPVHLIHGTKDLICSPENSDELQKLLPANQVTRYNVLAGHVGEAVTDDATVLATESIACSIILENRGSCNNSGPQSSFR